MPRPSRRPRSTCEPRTGGVGPGWSEATSARTRRSRALDRLRRGVAGFARRGRPGGLSGPRPEPRPRCSSAQRSCAPGEARSAGPGRAERNRDEQHEREHTARGQRPQAPAPSPHDLPVARQVGHHPRARIPRPAPVTSTVLHDGKLQVRRTRCRRWSVAKVGHDCSGCRSVPPKREGCPTITPPGSRL